MDDQAENCDGPDESLEELVRSPYFVDKTMIIKYLFEKVIAGPRKCLVLTIPKGFGKSTNLKLLKKFLEIPVDRNGNRLDRFSSKNYSFFNNNELDIFKDAKFVEENFAQHPVIYIDMKNFRIKSVPVTDVSFRPLVINTMREFSYLPEMKPYFYPKQIDPEAVNMSMIGQLIEDLFKKFEKPCFVILDMDVPPLTLAFFERKFDNELKRIRKSFPDWKHLDSIVDKASVAFIEESLFPMQSLLDLIFASTNVCKIIISRNISGETLYSDVHDCRKKFTYLNLFECEDLNNYYGFTEEDVISLIQKLPRINTNLLESVSNYYGGYIVEGGKQIFSMHSVSQFLKSGIFEAYSSTLDIPSFVYQCFTSFRPTEISREIQKSFTYQIACQFTNFYTAGDFQKIFKGNRMGVFLILQYLISCGFLTPNFQINLREGIGEVCSPFGKCITLSVPNLAARLSLEKLLFESQYYRPNPNGSSETVRFVEAIRCLNLIERAPLQNLAKIVVNLLVFPNPKNTSEVASRLFSYLRFSEVFSSTLRDPCDRNGERLVIKREDGTGIVLECKCNAKSAHEALENILRSCTNVFDGYTPPCHTILIGLHYSDRKECTLSCLFNSFEISDVIHVAFMNP